MMEVILLAQIIGIQVHKSNDLSSCSFDIKLVILCPEHIMKNANITQTFEPLFYVYNTCITKVLLSYRCLLAFIKSQCSLNATFFIKLGGVLFAKGLFGGEWNISSLIC